MIRENDHQKATRTTGHKDGQMDGRTYNIDWTPLGSFGPQCGYKFTATLDPHTGNKYKYKIAKSSTEDRTDGHIILPLGGVEPVACGHMRCA